MGASSSSPQNAAPTGNTVVAGAKNILSKYDGSAYVRAISGFTDGSGRAAVFARVQDSPPRFMFAPAASFGSKGVVPLDGTWVASVETYASVPAVLAEASGEESFAALLGVPTPLRGVTLRKVMLDQNVTMEGWLRSTSDAPLQLPGNAVLRRVAPLSQIYVLGLPDGQHRIVLRVTASCAQALDTSASPLRGLRSICT